MEDLIAFVCNFEFLFIEVIFMQQFKCKLEHYLSSLDSIPCSRRSSPFVMSVYIEEAKEQEWSQGAEIKNQRNNYSPCGK